MLRLFLTLTWLILLFGCGGLLAQETLTTKPVPDNELNTKTSDPAAKTGDSMFGTVAGRADRVHDYVSEGLESTAKSVDEFFAEDTVFEESTETYLRFGLDSVWSEYEGLGFAGELKLKLDLPHTQKRLKLLIESDPQRGDTENLEDKPVDVAQDRDFSASVEKVVSGLEEWNVRPALGIRLRSGRLDTFFRLRSHRYIPLDDWLLRIYSGVAWFDSRGYETYATLAFDRPLTQNLLFRYSPGLSWQENEMFRRFNQGFSIYQQIDARQQMAYQINAAADDAWGDWRSKRYDILVRYRRNLYKKWLFGEVIPQLTFQKEYNFHNKPAITFRLEAVFGERYR